ncbi:tRNA (adenosine(37)-N6)-threonylcarbamoyltransferase complex ATPase subunit type 1 TsaE [Candidatus Tachikawaea gelatinosa]|uniref:tRNA threonylcarbamoyladenosine biosynthesis protein TsaE n=1 Tax=Candidatus Tachikawaea gelatinosa TaxID=1410383 RepID=A0A090BWB1_9ENTR|nr:tRNA (adenosine(37)-N6)-threonylcarbamoyltransferase complex ATPase subunit type 1 TsaE [Candidatus Tachikawaea gelatinosa]BAP58296.1 ATPase YjeE [Candidatus Tachikawaea gelatinosa]
MKSYSILLNKSIDTINFGKKIAKKFKTIGTIYLYGNIGSGKTTFVYGFMNGFNYYDKINSPTYELVKSYNLKKVIIHHFDLYRLIYQDELYEIGIQDYLEEDSIFLIEWPKKGKKFLPYPDLSLFFFYKNFSRYVKIFSHSKYGQSILKKTIKDHE